MNAIKEPLLGSDLLQESEVQLVKFVQEKIFSAEEVEDFQWMRCSKAQQ